MLFSISTLLTCIIIAQHILLILYDNYRKDEVKSENATVFTWESATRDIGPKCEVQKQMRSAVLAITLAMVRDNDDKQINRSVY